MKVEAEVKTRFEKAKVGNDHLLIIQDNITKVSFHIIIQFNYFYFISI